MHRILSAVIVLALVGSLANTADAQRQRPGIREVHKHNGFWASAGAGGGWSDTDLSFGNDGRGASLYVRMGGTVNPQVLVGVELIGWGRSDFDDQSRGNLMVSGIFYPSIRGGWFLKTGFGAAGYERQGVERDGIGSVFGTGFDLRIGRNFYITPNVDYMVQFFEDDTVGSLLFTVGATIH